MTLLGHLNGLESDGKDPKDSVKQPKQLQTTSNLKASCNRAYQRPYNLFQMLSTTSRGGCRADVVQMRAKRQKECNGNRSRRPGMVKIGVWGFLRLLNQLDGKDPEV